MYLFLSIAIGILLGSAFTLAMIIGLIVLYGKVRKKKEKENNEIPKL